MIDVKTQNILWKGAFDLKYDKLLTVQDSVAQQIVKGLQLSLSPREVESLRPEKPVDPLAYEYYLRGVDLYSQNEFPMAIKMLRRSAEIDPGYSLTWAHLGRALTANASFELGGREEYREAQAAYEKALSLQPAPDRSLDLHGEPVHRYRPGGAGSPVVARQRSRPTPITRKSTGSWGMRTGSPEC